MQRGLYGRNESSGGWVWLDKSTGDEMDVDGDEMNVEDADVDVDVDVGHPIVWSIVIMQ